MAKRQTHTLDIVGKHVYSMSSVERRSLPELQVKVDYIGRTEEGLHVWEGHVKLIGAGQKLSQEELPEKLRKLVNNEDWMEITHDGKREGAKEAIEWGDQTIGAFLESGLFSIAVLKGPDGKSWEYHPDLKVVSARVYSA